MHHLLANLVVLIHLAFVAFVGVGGLLALRWRWVAWLHVPSAIWGAWVEFAGWICPLTPLENWLRGETPYPGGFVDHYLLPILYPSQLPKVTSTVLGLFVLAVNIGVYAVLIARYRSSHGGRAPNGVSEPFRRARSPRDRAPGRGGAPGGASVGRTRRS